MDGFSCAERHRCNPTGRAIAATYLAPFAPKLYSKMALYLCSSLQELHSEDPISFYSIPVLCGRKLFIGGGVASAARLMLLEQQNKKRLLIARFEDVLERHLASII